MKKHQILALVLLGTSLAYTATAAQIDGGITFSGGAAMDTNSVATATQVTAWNGVTVSSRSGDFVGHVNEGDAVSLVAPWTFDSGPVANFWTLQGFAFSLVSSEVVTQTSAGLIVTGEGWLSGNGFDATWGSWNFSSQNPSAQGVFSFSASGEFAPPPTNVPDHGTTAVMLGSALLIVALAGSRRTQAAVS